jgi:hypothetical protein
VFVSLDNHCVSSWQDDQLRLPLAYLSRRYTLYSGQGALQPPLLSRGIDPPKKRLYAVFGCCTLVRFCRQSVAVVRPVNSLIKPTTYPHCCLTMAGIGIQLAPFFQGGSWYRRTHYQRGIPIQLVRVEQFIVSVIAHIPRRFCACSSYALTWCPESGGPSRCLCRFWGCHNVYSAGKQEFTIVPDQKFGR